MEDRFDGDIVLEVATAKMPKRLRRSAAEECLEWTRAAFQC
jgi:hypothetical protein